MHIAFSSEVCESVGKANLADLSYEISLIYCISYWPSIFIFNSLISDATFELVYILSDTSIIQFWL